VLLVLLAVLLLTSNLLLSSNRPNQHTASWPSTCHLLLLLLRVPRQAWANTRLPPQPLLLLLC
jgi:hypothetical protein